MKTGNRHEATGNSKNVKVVGFVVCAMFFALCSFASAQQQGKVVRIGEIVFRSRPDFGPGRTAFRQQVDVLFASSTNEAQIFKNATTTIPIVFRVSTDPVADGLVDSLARPGGNITGVTTIATVLAGKRLELLKEIIPKLSRVAALWDPRDESSEQWWKENQIAAKELGLQLHSTKVSSADKFEEAFREMAKAHVAALSVSPGSVNTASPKSIIDLATKYKLPAVYDRTEFVTAGGLMSYGPDRDVSYRRAAVFVDRVLKGAKPADIPVEQPKKFELIINLKAAKQIGLTIPPNVLARADRVIR